MSMGRVLVVDDEADVRKSVRLILTKAGYDVVEAEDGEKGIATIKADGNALLVDTIVCDLYMPKVKRGGGHRLFPRAVPVRPRDRADGEAGHSEHHLAIQAGDRGLPGQAGRSGEAYGRGA